MVGAKQINAYRIWARNYDFSPREPVFNWVTLQMSLKYCDISTVVMTMDTLDFINTWYDDDQDPGTETSWLTNNYGNFNPQGTGVIIWRNNDTVPMFNGVISGVKRTRVSGVSDTVEVTFSSDEILLQDKLIYPDCYGGAWSCTHFGYYQPKDQLTGLDWNTGNGTGTWGPWTHLFIGGHNSGTGDQWDKITSTQGSVMGRLVNDTFNDPYTYRYMPQLDVVSNNVGNTVTYTQKFISVLDGCKWLISGDDDNTIRLYPYQEVRFWIEQQPVSGGVYLNFNIRQAPRKETKVIFSERLGNVSNLDYEEIRPGTNLMIVGGWGEGEYRMFRRVDTPNADISQNTYGLIEGMCDASGELGQTRAAILTQMDAVGKAQVTPLLFNKNVTATVLELPNQYILTPETGDYNFWIGDYVRVRLPTRGVGEETYIDNLVRQVDISVDSAGEVVTATVSEIASANKGWHNMDAHVKALERVVRQLMGSKDTSGTTTGGG
jgi:hypothetical protein